ncbi:hypothetical protein F0Q45_21810 [Mycobacterium simiae]|uniref:Uncharacterized protein n=1 Tax=Mycobacterium simiae TaxID=1784 RepID=A0A5B1BLA5_MYCSI|nr:hypothetical protein [Mycobacterium simiae]KAA1248213.1 hypothetical protein F0Q45_21810 [Mycobacterium simiae]
MTAPPAADPHILTTPVADVFADHTYQRPLDRQRVDRVAFFATAKKTSVNHGTGALPEFVVIVLHERHNLHQRAGARLVMRSGFRGVLRAGAAA